MRKSKAVKLTRKTAVGLIRSVVPVSPKAIEGGAQAPGAVIYTVQTGALDVTCSNDWYTCNGRIQLIVADRMGGGSIRLYFHPETLNRDYVAEEADRQDDRREARITWAQSVGKERAHKFVDQYLEGC